MTSVGTLAFKENNGFSRPSYPICTPDSKEDSTDHVLLPQHWGGCFWGDKWMGLIGGGQDKPFLEGKRTK